MFFHNCNKKSFPPFHELFSWSRKSGCASDIFITYNIKTRVILVWFPELQEPLLLILLSGTVYMRVLNLERSFDFPGTIHKLNSFMWIVMERRKIGWIANYLKLYTFYSFFPFSFPVRVWKKKKEKKIVWFSHIFLL